MLTRLLAATLHLLGMAIALGSIYARARALRRPLDPAGLARVFAADSWWGVSFFLLVGTGLWRAFSALEKGAAYYFGNPLFHAKLGVLALILALELWPMLTLIRWRIASRRGEMIDKSAAPRFAVISDTQTLLIIVMVSLATAIARGVRP